MPLTLEQFQKARQSGFTTEQIVAFEKKRELSVPETPVDTRSSLTKTLSSSEKQKPSGDPLIDAGIFVQKEIVGPVAQGANTALLGAPKYLTKAIAGEDFANQAFPQQSTMAGKIARFGSEATGLVAGGVGKVASGVSGRIIPKAGATLGQKVIGNLAAGAASGAVMPTEDIRDIKGRVKNTVLGGIGGAALPVAGKVASYIPKGAKTVAQNMYNNMVRLPASAVKFSKDPLSVFSKEKIIANSTDEFATKAKELLDIRSKQLNDAISSSNETLNAESIINKHLEEAASKSVGSLKDRTSGLKELEFAKEQLKKQYGDLKNLTVQNAVKLKRQLADDFPFVAEDPNNINTKAAHKIYHDINEMVEKAHPEIADLNQRVSGLIDISSAAKNRALIESRNNPFGMIDTALGLGGTFLGGGPITGVALVVAKKALGSVAVQTRVAKALTQMSEIDLTKLVTNNPWLRKVESPAIQKEMQRLEYKPAEVPQYLKERANAPIPSLASDGGVIAGRAPESPLGLPSPKKVGQVTPQYLRDRADAPIEPLGVKRVPGTNPTPIPTKKIILENNRRQSARFQRPQGTIVDISTPETPKTTPRRIPKAKGMMTKTLGGSAAALGLGLGASKSEASPTIDIAKINKIESSGMADTIGDKGKAFGLNQIHLGTLQDFNKKTGKNYSKDDLMSASKNNEVADWYLNIEIPRMLKAYDKPDTIKNRLIAYNAGIKKVKNGSILPAATVKYLKKYGVK